jgi:hypothetical protein
VPLYRLDIHLGAPPYLEAFGAHPWHKINLLYAQKPVLIARIDVLQPILLLPPSPLNFDNDVLPFRIILETITGMYSIRSMYFQAVIASLVFGANNLYIFNAFYIP